MKRIALCIVGFLLTFGGVIMEERPNPLLLNGKPFGNALTINGVLAISVQDFAKGFGGTTSLPRQFQLQGNTLSAKVKMQDIHFNSTVNKASPMLMKATSDSPHVQKDGVVSTRVFINGGKAWIPVADLAKAFGVTNWNAPAGLQAGQPVSLNFNVNGDGILGK